MSLVLLGCVTHTAKDFRVVQTEEFEDFPVCDALLLHYHRLLPRPPGPWSGSWSWSSSCRALLLPQEGVGHVLQRQADGGLRQGALPPADGTFASHLLLVPELLQAGSAEAVAALEHHGVPEDLAADGTGQLLLQHGARTRGNSPRSKGRSHLGTLEERKFSRLRGSTWAQRHGSCWHFGNFLLQLWKVFSESSSLNAAGVLSDLDTVYEQPGLQIGRDSKNRFPSLLVNKGSRHNPHLPTATRFFENIQVELEGEGSEHLHHVLII